MKRLIATAAALMVMVTIVPAEPVQAATKPGWYVAQIASAEGKSMRLTPQIWASSSKHPSGKRARDHHRFVSIWFDVTPSKFGKFDVSRSYAKDTSSQKLKIRTYRDGFSGECRRTLSKKHEWCRVILEAPTKVREVDLTIQVRPEDGKRKKVGTWRLELKGGFDGYQDVPDWGDFKFECTSRGSYSGRCFDLGAHIRPNSWSYKADDGDEPVRKAGKGKRFVLIEYKIGVDFATSHFFELGTLTLDGVKHVPHGYGRHCSGSTWLSSQFTEDKNCRALFEISNQNTRPVLRYEGHSWTLPLVPQTRTATRIIGL